MLEKIWQWLKNLIQRVTGLFKKPQPPPPPQPPPRPKPSDAECEATFMQLLEGVNQGWSRGQVRGFLTAKRISDKEWIDWLHRFGERVLAADVAAEAAGEESEGTAESSAIASLRELAGRLVKFGEIRGEELGSVAGEIGRQILHRLPPPPVDKEEEGEKREIIEAVFVGNGLTVPEDTNRRGAEGAEEWLERGNELFFKGDFLGALASYERAVEINPDFHDAWFLRGILLGNLERYEEALASFERAVAIKPDFHDAWFLRGILLGNLERYEEALASFERAVAIKPDFHDAWFLRGILLGNLERYEEALASFERAVAIKPDFHDAWFLRGILLGNLERYEEALASFERAVAIKPDLHEAWNNRGVSLDNLGRYDEAVASYEQAVAIKPDKHEAWNNRGLSLDNLGRYDEAVASYEQAVAIKPDKHEAWNNRGLSLSNLGRYDEAVASYEQAVAIKPDKHEAWNNRGLSLSNLGRYDEAVASFDTALTIKRDKWEAWIGRGSAAGNSIHPLNPLQSLLSAPSALALANPALNQRGYEGELASYQEGLKYCRRDTHPEGWGRLHRAIGNAKYYRGQGDARRGAYWREARTSYHTALETLTETEFPEAHLDVVQSLIRVLVGLGKEEKDAADELRRRGSDLLRRLLADSQRSDWHKKQLALKFAGFNQLTVDICVQNRQPVQAWEFAEAGKNACLTWLLDAWSDDIPTPRWDDIRPLLNPSTAAIYWHQSPAALTTFILKHDAPQPLVLADSEFLTRLEDFEEWLKEWNQHYEEYRNLKQKADEEASPIRRGEAFGQIIPESKPIISNPNASPSPGSYKTEMLPTGKAGESQQKNHPWRTQMPKKLERLKEILDIPAILAELSGISELILIPHRELHPLPLESLFPDSFTLTRLPSAQMGITLLQQRQPAAAPETPFPHPALLSVEAPDSIGFPDLPLADVESSAIARMFAARRIGGADATVARVKDALQQPHRVFHFTGHGVAHLSNPALSYLALAGEDKLTVKELLALDLSRCDFASLSACETALTRNQTITAEYVGLVSGFICAGVASVLSTLWVVESDASALTMMQVYRQRSKGKSEAVALAKAVKWLKHLTPAKLSRLYRAALAKLPENEDTIRPTLKRELRRLAKIEKQDEKLFAHPYHWAAFAITGLLQ